MSGLNVTVDASQLERWASELSARGMRNAIRRAVDQSARAARKEIIPLIAADIGVPKSKIAAAVPKVKASTASNLTASWTISKQRIGILNVSGASIVKRGGLTASTHRLTGGGSARLNVKKAFVINANGGRAVVYRKSGSRKPLKAIYAETPATAMGQDGAAARVAWQREANKQVGQRLAAEVAKQLVAEGLGPSSPNND